MAEQAFARPEQIDKEKKEIQETYASGAKSFANIKIFSVGKFCKFFGEGFLAYSAGLFLAYSVK